MYIIHWLKQESLEDRKLSLKDHIQDLIYFHEWIFGDYRTPETNKHANVSAKSISADKVIYIPEKQGNR